MYNMHAAETPVCYTELKVKTTYSGFIGWRRENKSYRQ